MSAAERIEWWSDHPVLLWRLHPCDEIWDALDDEPANDNCPLASLAKTFPEQPNRAATHDKLSHLPLARGATASTRQGRGDAFRSGARTSVGRGLPHWRDAEDWPEGAKPVTKKIEYDDLYRATRIRYEYAAGDDEWKSPFQAEIDGSAANDDSRRAKPSPHIQFQKRILEQTFEYDWVGNNRKTGDDAKGFYDRSLGTIDDNDEAGKPYQLKGAALSGPSGGSLQARYDAAGYMTKMQLARDGACIGGSNPGDCDQQFVYEWDEVGRLARARRWDNNATSVDTFSPASAGTPAADLRHTYDASDQRVLKEAVDAQGNKSFTAYVFETLELRRAQFGEAFDDGAAPSVSDYEISHYTVVPYLLANGVRLSRVVYHASGDVPDETYNASGAPGDVNGPLTSSGKLHVFFELGDHLGSTSVVLDKATGELVERATFQGYGGAESDYRPDRWKSFREDYRFTGKEEDVEVGLQYFGKRYLNPLLGRWISADPLAVHAPGEADLNLYAYVSGQILRATDPLGLKAHSDAGKPARNTGGREVDFNPKRADQPGAAAPAPNGGDSNSYNGGKETGSYNGDNEFNNGIGQDNGVPFAEGDPLVGELGADGSTPEGKGNDPTLNETVADLTGDTNRAAHGSNEKGIGIGECQGDGCLDSELGAKAASLAVLADKIADVLSLGKAAGKAAVKWAMRGTKSLASRAWKGLKGIFKKRPPGGCFMAGTLVALEQGPVRIEHVRLGALIADTSQACRLLPRYGWARVDVEMQDAAGGFHGEASFLVQTHELADEAISVGKVIPFSVEEELFSEVARARVLQVTLDQELEAGSGCPVTATFKSTSSDLAEVWIDEMDAPVQATGGHLFYSASRGDWVPAAHLVPGEWLDTSEGLRTVRRIDYTPNHVEPVYTLEVADIHEFRVGELGARTHNADVCGGQHVEIKHPSERAARRAAHREAGIPAGSAPDRTVPSRPGSQAPSGPRGERSEWDPRSDAGVGAHHDPHGHRFPEGDTIGPHFGVDVPGKGTRHHTYPTDHDPINNR